MVSFDGFCFRFRMQNHTRPPIMASPAIAPTTMPAMAPPDIAELLSASAVADGEGEEPLEFAGSALSVLDQELSQFGGFLAGVIVVSAFPIFWMLELRKSGPGAWARKSLFCSQFWARKADCKNAFPRV